MFDNQIMISVYSMIDQFIAFIPKLVAIILLIIIGKILGTFLGKVGARILDRIGLDDLVDRTIIGGMIRRGQMSTVGLFSRTRFSRMKPVCLKKLNSRMRE